MTEYHARVFKVGTDGKESVITVNAEQRGDVVDLLETRGYVVLAIRREGDDAEEPVGSSINVTVSPGSPSYADPRSEGDRPETQVYTLLALCCFAFALVIIAIACVNLLWTPVSTWTVFQVGIGIVFSLFGIAFQIGKATRMLRWHCDKAYGKPTSSNT